MTQVEFSGHIWWWNNDAIRLCIGISRRFENIIGLTATTNQIDSQIFSELEKCYVEDEKLKQRMQKSNRWAYLNMLNRLAEAGNRGYWQPTDEEMERLQRAYLETEGEIEQ